MYPFVLKYYTETFSENIFKLPANRFKIHQSYRQITGKCKQKNVTEKLIVYGAHTIPTSGSTASCMMHQENEMTTSPRKLFFDENKTTTKKSIPFNCFQ